MFDFDAGTFSQIAESPTGLALWSYLNKKSTLIRFEAATDMKRPALEPVQKFLVEKFGDEIRGDRWKQMMGRMTRQIMEHHGFSLDQTGVRIRNGELFTSAARYTR